MCCIEVIGYTEQKELKHCWSHPQGSNFTLNQNMKRDESWVHLSAVALLCLFSIHCCSSTPVYSGNVALNFHLLLCVQEPLIQPSWWDHAPVFQPQVLQGSRPALWQRQQTRWPEPGWPRPLPQHEESVSVGHPEGRPISRKAGVFWFGPVWKLS